MGIGTTGSPVWIEFSEGFISPLDLLEERAKVQCRGQHRRTTTNGASGVSPYVGFNLRKLEI